MKTIRAYYRKPFKDPDLGMTAYQPFTEGKCLPINAAMVALQDTIFNIDVLV